MRIFYFSSSINFIDETDVFLGFSLEQSCSERLNFKLAYDRNMKKEIDTDDLDEVNEIIEGYLFNRNFMLSYYDGKNIKANIAVFRMEKDNAPDIYLFLSNGHNGHYAKGFSLKKISMQDFNEEFGENVGEAEEDEDRSYQEIEYEKEEYLLRKNQYIVNEALILDIFKSGRV